MTRVHAVGGPTGAGKSELGARLAERLGAAVVSADAMQVYRGMDIGTAKVDAATRARVPHLALDVRDPDEPFDVADFLRIAEAAIADGPVVVVGGTHLYHQALRRGLVETPEVQPALREQILAEGGLHRRLADVDPALAARLHPHDEVRLLRGIEVFLQAGRPLSALQAEHAAAPDRHEVIGLWLDHPDLDERIDARVRAMIEAGYVDEVRGLLARGYGRQLKPMSSLGYRHLCDHLMDGLDLEEAVRRTQRDTRRFARKQRTWAKALGYRPLGPGDRI